MNSAIELIRSAVAQSDNLLDFDEIIRTDPGLFRDRDYPTVRAAAKVGQSVKVGASGEYFWVEVVDRTEAGVFFGRIDNTLLNTAMHGLKRDDIIAFGPEHIRVVETDERFPAPSIWNKPLVMNVGAGRPPEYVDDMGGDYMTLAEFRSGVEDTCFTDYDGYGYAVSRGDVACTTIQINPSSADRVPEGTTHIIWFNK